MTRSEDGSARRWDLDPSQAAADICSLSRAHHWRDLNPELLAGSLCT
ncbi:hypothetical protein [Streptomyces platensis]